MTTKLGWHDRSRTRLPRGYELRSDPEFAYLYHGEELVAVFGQHADPTEISKKARGHKTQRSETL